MFTREFPRSQRDDIVSGKPLTPWRHEASLIRGWATKTTKRASTRFLAFAAVALLTLALSAGASWGAAFVCNEDDGTTCTVNAVQDVNGLDIVLPADSNSGNATNLVVTGSGALQFKGTGGSLTLPGTLTVEAGREISSNGGGGPQGEDGGVLTITVGGNVTVNGVVTANGRNQGGGTDTGGDGGTLTLIVGGNLNIAGSVAANGGAGGNKGGTGGDAGTVILDVTGNLANSGSSIAANGGAGGNGENAAGGNPTGNPGGNGGDGGTLDIMVDGSFLNTGAVEARGGTGGNGGKGLNSNGSANGGPGRSGGAGGDGGDVTIVAGGDITEQGNTISTEGGAGGNGGAGGDKSGNGSANNGDGGTGGNGALGGAGGPIGVTTGGELLVGGANPGSMSSNGGKGGNGGAGGAKSGNNTTGGTPTTNTGNGGNGGNGAAGGTAGAITAQACGTLTVASNGSVTAKGGAGGNGGNGGARSGSGNGNGGNGGNNASGGNGADIMLHADDTLTVESGGTVDAQGGAKGSVGTGGAHNNTGTGSAGNNGTDNSNAGTNGSVTLESATSVANSGTVTPNPSIDENADAQCSIDFNVDIGFKGNSTSPFACRSKGTVPVSVYSTETFDATLVDPSTVTLAGVPAEDKSAVGDFNGDGLADKKLFFSAADLAEAIECPLPRGTEVVVEMAGEADGTQFSGETTIHIVGGGNPH